MKLFGKLFKKQSKPQAKNPMLLMTDAEKIELMSKHLPEFLDCKIIETSLSQNKMFRFMILENNNGTFSYIIQQLFFYDDETLEHLSATDTPGYWQDTDKKNSIFDTFEHAKTELEAEPEFKTHFL